MATAPEEGELIEEGFIARGDTNQSDGFGPSYEVGRFSTLEEARAAARGKGVQGDPGTVSSFRTVEHASRARHTTEKRLIDRRRVPEGSYLVGFLDLREYEYGVRPADLNPVRPADTSIWNRSPFALSEAESGAYPVLSSSEVRETLLNSGAWVGLWRRAGDLSWRGEFSGGTDAELDRWLPRKVRLR